KKKGASKAHNVDQYVPSAAGYSVNKDWDCMLNQTNINNNNNNNKYYVIQMLKSNSKNNYHVWNRWGRVGERGDTFMHGPFSTEDAASVVIKKKFKDKTKNDWDKRDNFVAQTGKYTLIEMADEDDEDNCDNVVLPKVDGEKPKKD
ncbi:WGR domain-containing protein, partial [Salmonella sp. s51228]|uniref:WGR domain-containing protein n=1 Tax=Salmonella sp. s51228 TaxID=3159652 RepID=UPI0039817ED7